MAQSAQQLNHICHNCRQSLRKSIWSKPTRAFSTTSARRKVIPSFASTSNPSFDEFLLTWRQKVFMPAAVEAHHRALMYKESNRAILAKEPGVTVVMEDDEEVKLETRDAYDKPHVQKSLIQLVRYLDGNQNDADWDNLVPFLNGLAMAKQNLRQTFPPKITRKACEVGKEHIIISCAAKTKETGLSLRQAEVAKELMLGQHTQAVLAGFEGPEMETIRRRAELVARMLEDQLSTTPKLEKGECDARRDPVVLAVLLELAAEKAVHKHNGEDQDGLVANYANKLLHLQGWKSSFDLQGATTFEQNLSLVDLIPIQNSMRWALKVGSVKQSDSGVRLDAELQSLTLLVESTADSLRAAVGNKPQRGLQMFDQLYEMGTGNAAVEAPKSTPSASPSEGGREEQS